VCLMEPGEQEPLSSWETMPYPVLQILREDLSSMGISCFFKVLAGICWEVSRTDLTLTNTDWNDQVAKSYSFLSMSS